jgi:hypothetical protein
MAAKTDPFIVATFALWAGDFAYVAEHLREFSPPHNTPSIDDGAESPEDFIRATGALRLRQLRQKRGEFKKLTSEYADQDVEITDKPIILETKHLRATVWRIGEREFVMQGYLRELSWQNRLFELAHREASRNDAPKVRIPKGPAYLIESEAEGEPLKPLGVAWAVAQNPFIQVELTDMGLLEATGLWTERRLPQDAEAITKPFLNLLNALDKPLTKPTN